LSYFLKKRYKIVIYGKNTDELLKDFVFGVLLAIDHKIIDFPEFDVGREI